VTAVWFLNGLPITDERKDVIDNEAKWYLVMAILHGDYRIDPRPLEQSTWAWDWRLCRLPIAEIFPNEFAHQDPARLEAIRRGPPEAIPPILGELTTNNRVRLLDGSHRITIAGEQGVLEIKAFVGNPIV